MAKNMRYFHNINELKKENSMKLITEEKVKSFCKIYGYKFNKKKKLKN